MSDLARSLIAEAKRTRAKKLDLGNCGLTDWPEELFELVWLEELVMSNGWSDYKTRKWVTSQNDGIHNQLNIFSPSISKLTKLKKLFVSVNSGDQSAFVEIPPLKELGQLQLIDLAHSSISDISPLKELLELRTIDLGSTNVLDISPIEELHHLRLLEINSTIISDISPLKELKQLQSINLGKTQVSDLSPLEGLTQLRDINLIGTQISNISALKELKQLQSINLGKTQVSDLSPLEGLTQLRDINLIGTQISNISALKELKQLQTINLAQTKVSDISPLKELKQLQDIDIRETQISDISPIKDLKQLQAIDLGYTKVSDLTPLLHLIESGIPVVWGTYYTKGAYTKGAIYVANCPLTIPPPEVVKEGNEAILRYFNRMDTLKTDEKDKLYEAKILILGEGDSGKTSLYRKLVDPDAELPGKDETTEGIDIHQLPFETAEGNTFNINLWDFGGQEIYHATHQFFLTKRSLYVLVTDGRKDDTDFNYWLQVVEMVSNNCPIIILQNVKGIRKDEIDLGKLQERFSNIVTPEFYVDLKNDREALDKLKKEVLYQIQKLDHIGMELPKSWVDIRKELMELKDTKPYIHVSQYKSICEDFGVTKKDDIEDLSSLFHDLGVFLHFKSDAVLKKTIILENEWATDGVYAILDTAKIKDQKGRFARAEAEEIWSSEKYKGKYDEMHEELVRLMMKFELCYEIPDTTPSQYISPQLLSKKQPDYPWNNAGNLQLRYDYDFMPKGILGRLIVRMNRYIQDVDNEAWRSGVVLHRENTKAEITETFDRRAILIRIKGQNPKEMMTIVSEQIDILNDTFPQLKKDNRLRKQIPCNCYKCIDMVEPTFYEFEDLKRRKEKGKSTIECKISYEDIPVQGLLDAVFADKSTFTNKVPKVFISYSKKDVSYLQELDEHLSTLKRQEHLATWFDHELLPGEEWDVSIKQELNTADIILFLVSSSFLATGYIMDTELPIALERRKNKSVEIVPIILRPCDWQETQLGQLNALPHKAKPISKWEDTDDACLNVVEGIKRLIRDLGR